MVTPKIMPEILKNLFFCLPNISSENIIIKEVSLIKNPAQPAVLNIRVLKDEEIKRTTMPEGAPEIKVAKKMGISEMSSFKKGKTGKMESLPRYPSIKVITINTELYVILSVLFVVIIFVPLTYTKY